VGDDTSENVQGRKKDKESRGVESPREAGDVLEDFANLLQLEVPRSCLHVRVLRKLSHFLAGSIIRRVVGGLNCLDGF